MSRKRSRYVRWCLPLEVLVAYHWYFYWFSILYVPALFLYKAALPWDTSTPLLFEGICYVVYVLVSGWRLNTTSEANKIQSSFKVFLSLVLSIIELVLVFAYMQFQGYITRSDVWVSVVGFAWTIAEAILCLAVMCVFQQSDDSAHAA